MERRPTGITEGLEGGGFRCFHSLAPSGEKKEKSRRPSEACEQGRAEKNTRWRKIHQGLWAGWIQVKI